MFFFLIMMLSLLSQVKQKTWIQTLADTLTSTPCAAPPGPPRLMYYSQNQQTSGVGVADYTKLFQILNKIFW